MGFLRSSKSDPIAERARALNQEIAALEAKIRDLGTQLPEGDAVQTNGDPPGSLATAEPVFEPVVHLPSSAEDPGQQPGATHYNELGVRKYDLPALLRRLRQHFRGPAASNPKLVSYLAAGGIQGLRPLRYEKRVARNRFIFFVVILFLAMLGTLLVFLKGHR